MSRNNVFPTSLLLVVIGLFYSWTLSLKGNLWLTSLGVNILQIIIGITSMIWLVKAYHHADRRQMNFWRLLIAGLFLYMCANGIWLYLQIVQEAIYSTTVSHLVWLIAHLFFLASLISKTRELSGELSGKSYTFNIAVFMITATSISFYYLIHPVLEVADQSWMVAFTKIGYPVSNLSTLLVAMILYSLIQKNKKQEILLLIVSAFFIKAMADFLFIYAVFNGSYQAGHLAELLWILSVLFMGFAGYYASVKDRNNIWNLKNLGKNQDAIFPYLSILVLLVLVIHSYQYQFNALSIGLLLIFFMVLGRQLYILRKNRHLMNEYRYLAYHDPLTNLRNRVSFMEEIEHIVAENPSKQIALLLFDLDQFKVVNDTMGHHIGDKVLIKTAERLKSVIEENMQLFRIGGDEFIIVILDATDEKCIALANNLLDLFHELLDIEEYQLNITPSIGISKFPEHGKNAEELMKNADAAMYFAKENGKNNFNFFNAELNRGKIRKMTIETELKKAIQKNQFQLYYQPKINLRTSEIMGMEALLRWQHPELGWVSPVEFIPVAEETGQIVAIGKWVLQEACRQNKEWQEKGFPPLTVSVNVSVMQFKHGKFLDTVAEVLAKTGLDTRYLELEITESIMQNIEESTVILKSLREMGIKTSIDDFGTGYSSLHVLQKLPIDTLKIDKSFVDTLDSDTMNPMVKTIIDLGLNLNLTIVAEGIEDENQLKLLVEHGCLIGQGYLFSKPVAPNSFEELVMAPIFVNDKTGQTA